MAGPEFEVYFHHPDGDGVEPMADLHEASQLGWGLDERGVEHLRALSVGKEWTFVPPGMMPITVKRLRCPGPSRYN